VALSSDITERKQREEQVRQLAFTDALTGLPNRRLLTDRMRQTVLTNKRSGHYAAAMYLDLDNFKPLNDRHGHAAGDQLLIEVANRLRACVREVDTVARIGGDEFVVMLSELDTDAQASGDQASAVAEKIRASLAAPYVLTVRQPGQPDGTVEHHGSCTIGVKLFSPTTSDLDAVLREADRAMYQAKELGRNRVVFTQMP
jgi:diguanylate cyclase (GGDEF)-like protein